jgi:hypothetical protein
VDQTLSDLKQVRPQADLVIAAHWDGNTAGGRRPPRNLARLFIDQGADCHRVPLPPCSPGYYQGK